MNTITQTSLTRSVAVLARKWLAAFRDVRQSKHALAHLDDRSLRDIGLTRGQVSDINSLIRG